MIECHECPAHGVRFIPIEKCAGTSIIALLFDLSGSVEKIHADKPERVTWTPDGDQTFAVIRHPWSRLVSTWANKVNEPHRPDTNLIRRYGFQRGMSFGAFIDAVQDAEPRNLDRHLAPQVDFLPSEGVDLLVFECLLEEWARRPYLARIGTPDRLNRSHATSGATVAQVDKVKAMYAEDYELWTRLHGRLVQDAND